MRRLPVIGLAILAFFAAAAPAQARVSIGAQEYCPAFSESPDDVPHQAYGVSVQPTGLPPNTAYDVIADFGDGVPLHLTGYVHADGAEPREATSPTPVDAITLSLTVDGRTITERLDRPCQELPQPPPVRCYQTITRDTKLDRTLICHSGVKPGLTIGAARITLDLDGHEIETLNGGAVANEGHDDVTIENGILDAYEVPILLSGANRNVIRKVETHSATFESYLLDADSNKIAQSRGGFYLDERSDDNLLSRDEFTGLDGDVLEGDRNVIADSHVDVNDEGVSISGDQNLVTRTKVVEGRGFGIVVESGEGNVLSRNQLLGAFGDGIGIEAAAQHTLVRSNSASGNTDDGIQVDSAGATLIRNVATGNGDLGIESVPGMIAEGNFASGNGNPLQCLNVACRG